MQQAKKDDTSGEWYMGHQCRRACWRRLCEYLPDFDFSTPSQDNGTDSVLAQNEVARCRAVRNHRTPATVRGLLLLSSGGVVDHRWRGVVEGIFVFDPEDVMYQDCAGSYMAAASIVVDRCRHRRWQPQNPHVGME